ncbi:MAG: tetratricopeptide repeat protein [Acidobacteriota bacterium]
MSSAPSTVPTCGDPVLDWLAGRANREIRRGEIDSGVAHLEKLVTLEPPTDMRLAALLLLGDIWAEREEPSRALHPLREACDLAPESSEAHQALGLAQAQLENSKAAAASFGKALKLRPRDAELSRSLGMALAACGEDDEASRHLRAALKLAPDDIRVLESFAAHALKVGRFAECAEVLQKATILAPDNRFVRRLNKEASYLLELATGERSVRREPTGPRATLPGTAGIVEAMFSEQMGSSGFVAQQVSRARDLWRDYLALRRPKMRRPAEYAAAIHHALARVDFVDGCSREEIALRYQVSEKAISRRYRDYVSTLDIAVFDPRYTSQTQPAPPALSEIELDELQPEEVFRALLEEEYREYEENHSSSDAETPRLEIHEFEDASVEYGSLLTRELMGLTLPRNERRRKRELERLLMVT